MPYLQPMQAGHKQEGKLQKTALLLGSNRGDRLQFIRQAKLELKSIGEIQSISSVYQTKAWGVENQQDFLNVALILASRLSPLEMLDAIKRIEEKLGRTASQKWHEREIDIDLLLMEDTILQHPRLEVPHPYLAERRFSLLPLAEIAADSIHPIYQCSISQLLTDCKDPLAVEKVAEPLII